MFFLHISMIRNRYGGVQILISLAMIRKSNRGQNMAPPKQGFGLRLFGVARPTLWSSYTFQWLELDLEVCRTKFVFLLAPQIKKVNFISEMPLCWDWTVWEEIDQYRDASLTIVSPIHLIHLMSCTMQWESSYFAALALTVDSIQSRHPYIIFASFAT